MCIVEYNSVVTEVLAVLQVTVSRVHNVRV